jgi:hypothetical protein
MRPWGDNCHEPATHPHNRYRLEAVIDWWRRRASLRAMSLAVGVLAAAAMVVVGCEAVTQGNSTIDRADAPVYRASVSASIEDSRFSSSTRESQRLVTLSKQALHTACDALSSSSVDAIDAVNVYVRAYNSQSGDTSAKRQPAVDALNRTADLVAANSSQTLSPQLAGALNDYTSAARAVSSAIATNAGLGQFNAATSRMNDVRRVALQLCDAGY